LSFVAVNDWMWNWFVFGIKLEQFNYIIIYYFLNVYYDIYMSLGHAHRSLTEKLSYLKMIMEQLNTKRLRVIMLHNW
jgi:hypothetical protein